MTNAFRKNMKKGDVHLLATIEPDSQKIIDEAKKAREMGMFVVSIAPANSLKIRFYSDVFIDNLSPEGGGFMQIDAFFPWTGALVLLSAGGTTYTLIELSNQD
jgi:DNA-binding MurR/RpiR family transcriptional regulator